ncbi:MAG: hypothetical protein V3T30_08885 [Thermodesulfobacteriota bacterium]
MAIISFDPDAVIDYIPKYGSNRDSDHPCVIMLKFVPYSKVQHYSRMIAGRLKSLSDTARAAEITQEVQRKQFVDNVESISGYFVGDAQVTGAGEFYDTADTELITEVITAMESHSKLSEGQRKN